MKKPTMIIGKKQIILAGMTLILGLAVYINYAVSTSDGKIKATDDVKSQSVNYGDAQLVSTDSTSDYFAQARIDRMNSRDEAVETLKNIMNGGDSTEEEKKVAEDNRVTLNNLFEKMESENLKQLNIIVKADVQGTAEALKQSLEKVSNEEVCVKVIHSGVGAVNESDVQLAKAAKAIIIAFDVRPNISAKDMAEKDGVEIKQYSVIYQAIEEVEAAMKGMLDPVYEEKVIGNAEVRQTFKVSNVGTIAGCYVLDGKIERNAGVRVIRENVVIHQGKLVSLKRFKDDVKEVTKGFECGIQIEKYNDLKELDILEFFVMEEVKK